MNFIDIDTNEINHLKKEIPTTFIPGIINKEFFRSGLFESKSIE